MDRPSPTTDWTLERFGRGDRRDRRTLRAAYAVAVIVHLLLLAVHLPSTGAEEVAPPEPPKVFKVQVFRPPPPEPPAPEELIKPRTRRMPMPAEDPDAPEPLPRETELHTQLDLPTSDPIFDIPSEPPPVPDPGPVRMGEGITRPVVLEQPQPRYTEIARRAGITGVVIVEAVIDASGQVRNARLLKGLSFGLDEAALRTIRDTRFEPATLRGKPISVYYTLSVHFNLQ